MGVQHTIEDFHGDDVWRDEDGTVWVRQAELVARVVELEAMIQKVRSYADDRAWYGRTNRTVGSARIASDLFQILDSAPSVVLADHDAAVWQEGFDTGAEDVLDASVNESHACKTNPYQREASHA